MWKKATILAAIGFVLGYLIGLLFYLQGPSGTYLEALPNHLLGGVYGAVAMASSLVYGIEKWSILRATVTHFLLITVLYYTLSLSLGWFEPGDTVFWIITVSFVVGYVIVWLVQYLIYRRKVRRMNETLRKWKTSKPLE